MYTDEQRSISDEVKRMTEAIEQAIAARTAYMDANMEKFCGLKVGEDIYDIVSGIRLGKVSRLYRYWSGRNPSHDTSMSVSVEYETYPQLLRQHISADWAAVGNDR